jgi:hypothetical protein
MFPMEINTLGYSQVKATMVFVRLQIYLFVLTNTYNLAQHNDNYRGWDQAPCPTNIMWDFTILYNLVLSSM